MSENQGISKLLAAEETAAKQIAQAKAARTTKLKEAREQAVKESERLREDLENEFKKAMSEGQGGSGTAAAFAKKLEQQAAIDKAKVEVSVYLFLSSFINDVHTYRSGGRAAHRGVCHLIYRHTYT